VDFAHEMGHIHSDSGNADHCRFGHRRVFDSTGMELGGPVPDTMSVVAGVFGTDPDVTGIVETPLETPYTGFYTTMAYWTGDGNAQTYKCHFDTIVFDTYMGVQRAFKFKHQGRSVNASTDWWTGTYSNPNINWINPVTSTLYPTGEDTIRYINRLKYWGESYEVHRDTATYHRNFSDVLNANANTIRELKGFPSDLTIKDDMSLGHNTADSQWVYAHFVATNSVTIEPGFRVTDGTSMRITVSDGGSMLAKSGRTSLGAKEIQASATAISSELEFRYDAATQSIGFTLLSEASSRVAVSVYDLRGSRKVVRTFSPAMGNSTSGSLSVRELPAGIYVARIHAGGKQYQRRFLKW
jgi:hypothetical protein